MKKKKLELTIAIIVFNNYENVKKTVDTIETHTRSDIKKKIYLIDNSTGENIINLESIINYKDTIIIKNKKNLGFAKANNVILKNLESEYHAIVNPDIVLKEDSFYKILNFMDKKKVDMAIPRLANPDGTIQLDYRREISLFDILIRPFKGKIFKKRYMFHTMQDHDFSVPFEVPFGQGSFLVIRTNLMKKLDGFDENFFMYLEDADLCKRVNKISKLIYFPGTTVTHLWSRGSHRNIKLLYFHICSLIKYFKKWGLKFI
ncbi:MAG: glycosyltransferase family 2 protein [Liquorilactobacillus nagelii]|jgi:GT2 family glycosyltransferase|uniref:glycosyltransferase n=1 Tax=Liquorilactobacillus nagelii TaxID=82688 RepID=UPI002431CACE|nr:glycosyltransferase family 2 protein [Liquorilactobacillus nagelii]MCI1922063.1 glycosyltransferase family 2 protein [Liquorilactobacillus nagelii]MCI1977450.1 glycosyltransferase family 2 protein [Liquorilactobacillus nagelii]